MATRWPIAESTCLAPLDDILTSFQVNTSRRKQNSVHALASLSDVLTLWGGIGSTSVDRQKCGNTTEERALSKWDQQSFGGPIMESIAGITPHLNGCSPRLSFAYVHARRLRADYSYYARQAPLKGSRRHTRTLCQYARTCVPSMMFTKEQDQRCEEEGSTGKIEVVSVFIWDYHSIASLRKLISKKKTKNRKIDFQ